MLLLLLLQRLPCHHHCPEGLFGVICKHSEATLHMKLHIEEDPINIIPIIIVHALRFFGVIMGDEVDNERTNGTG